MKFRAITFIIMLVFVAACNKRKYPEEKIQLESEDIYCDALFGGAPVNLKIGTDGYYCYSSYRQTTDSIYVFEGELKKFDCNPCPQSLKLELFDYRQRMPGTAVLPDSSLRAGRRDFLSMILRPAVITFSSYSNKKISSVQWNVSNGFSSTDSALDLECAQPGVQTVSLTVRTTDNCESMVVNKIFAGGKNAVFACYVRSTPLQNTSSTFSANIIGGTPPFRYTWHLGDGTVSNLETPEHTYLYAGGYPVKLIIVDFENDTCESDYIHIAGKDQSSCASNTTLKHNGTANGLLDKVRIQWTDNFNVVFRSDGVAQPAASYFEILNSQPYEPNERGEPGRLLTVKFNVLLSDGNNKVWFKSDNTVIAVTYK
jgi:PKD repeat protein